MKMSKILSLVLVLVMLVGMTSCELFGSTHKCESVCPTCGKCLDKECTEKACADKCPGHVNPLAGTYDVTLWVSELDGVAELTAEQIDAFEAANPGIIINAEIEGVTEADAGSKVIADVATAPDIYCFAQDQLARLVQASALAAPGGDIADAIKAANDGGSVAAASSGGTLWAYPMTSDNGYYLYYDKSVITNPDSLEQIIADCEAAGKSFAFELENGWYTASFFFGVGCTSSWEVAEDGKTFLSVADNFNSDKGLVAMKGMSKVTNSKSWVNSSGEFAGTAAMVTGIWKANDALAAYGENLGATDLPSFTVDGKSHHLGSFTGNKLMGVKPQEDSKKGAVLQLLAQWLTNETCQLERYNQFQWGPSNLAAQQSEAVQSNPSLAAFALQANYGQPQNQIHGDWWNAAALLGTNSYKSKDEGAAYPTDDQLRGALTQYEETLKSLFVVKEVHTWGVVGSFAASNWGGAGKDVAMKEDPAGTWTSEVVALKAGDEIKVRMDESWNAGDYGQATEGVEWAAGHSEAAVAGGKNIKIAADGNYRVVLVINGDSATITLVEYVCTWGVVGSYEASGWADGKDCNMTEDPSGTWTSDVLTLKAGDQFKVRMDGKWDTNYGQATEGVEWAAGHSEAGVSGGQNIVVAADGNYRVVLVFDGENATITLVAAE